MEDYTDEGLTAAKTRYSPTALNGYLGVTPSDHEAHREALAWIDIELAARQAERDAIDADRIKNTSSEALQAAEVAQDWADTLRDFADSVAGGEQAVTDIWALKRSFAADVEEQAAEDDYDQSQADFTEDTELENISFEGRSLALDAALAEERITQAKYDAEMAELQETHNAALLKIAQDQYLLIANFYGAESLAARTQNLEVITLGGAGAGYASGGLIPGSGSGDTVPAMLTPGEFVIRKKIVKTFGADLFAAVNQGLLPLPKFNLGGLVSQLPMPRFNLPALNLPMQHFASGGIVQPGATGETINVNLNFNGASASGIFQKNPETQSFLDELNTAAQASM